MGYWNWINEIYCFDDAVFKYFEAEDEVNQLIKIIKDNKLNHLIYDDNGNYKLQFKDEYDGFKRENLTNNNAKA